MDKRNVLGIDFGNRNIKTSSMAIFKSAVEEIEKSEYKKRNTAGYKMQIGEKYFKIGEGREETNLIKTDRKNIIEMVYGAIIISLDDIHAEGETYKTEVHMGLPNNQYREKQEEMKNIIQNNATRNIEYQGKNITVHITNVEIYPEGVGAYYSYEFETQKYSNENIIIVDIGALTTDISELRPDHSIVKMDSLNFGTTEMNYTIAQKFNLKYGSKFVGDDIPQIIENGYVRKGADKLPIEWVKEHLEVYAEDIAGYLKTKHNAEMKPILITGGGAYLLTGLLKNKYEQIEPMEHLIFGNALGYQYLGE